MFINTNDALASNGVGINANGALTASNDGTAPSPSNDPGTLPIGSSNPGSGPFPTSAGNFDARGVKNAAKIHETKSLLGDRVTDLNNAIADALINPNTNPRTIGDAVAAVNQAAATAADAVTYSPYQESYSGNRRWNSLDSTERHGTSTRQADVEARRVANVNASPVKVNGNGVVVQQPSVAGPLVV